MAPQWTGNNWRTQYTDASGRRQSVTWGDLRKRTKKDRTEAELREAELKLKVRRQRLGLENSDVNPEGLTVVEAFDRWWDAHGKGLAWSDTARGYFRKHVAPQPWASKRLEHVTQAEAAAFMLSLPVSATTARKIRASILQGIYTQMSRLGLYSGPNPWSTAPDPKGEPTQRIAIPSRYVWPIIEAATPGRRPFFLLAAFMGMRLGEITRAKGADYDEERNALRVWRNKAGKPRLVPIHPEVAPVLVPLLESTRGLLWPAVRGAKKGKVTTPSGGRLMRRAIERAGLDLEGVTFHSLRHTWATRFIECGGDRLARHAIGWGSRSGRVDEDVYTHLPVEFLHRELARLAYPKAGE